MLPEYYLIAVPAIFLAIIFFIICIFNPKLNILLISLTLYWGTLLSVEMGFTLKAVQVFAVFAFISLLLGAMLNDKALFRLPVFYYFPFLLFIFTIFLSLINSNETESLKLLLNYLWLLLTAFVLIVSIRSENIFKKVIQFSFLSCLITVIIGYFQQIGYYTHLYDPFQYFDTNSVFANLYGPVLRMSPGTFANEYGEILQTNAIMITTYLLLGRHLLKFKERIFYGIFLFSLILSLIINLTRISWFVYIVAVISLLFITTRNSNYSITNNRGRWKTLMILFLSVIFSIMAIYTAGISFFDINIINVISDRFTEFSALTSYSAGARLEAWQEAFDVFLENPLIGNGFGTMVYTHNIFLQLLAETGILGLLAFCFMFGFVFWKTMKAIKITKSEFLKVSLTGIALSLTGCFIFDLTNHGIHHFVLWFLTALALAGSLLGTTKETEN